MAETSENVCFARYKDIHTLKEKLLERRVKAGSWGFSVAARWCVLHKLALKVTNSRLFGDREPIKFPFLVLRDLNPTPGVC